MLYSLAVSGNTIMTESHQFFPTSECPDKKEL